MDYFKWSKVVQLVGDAMGVLALISAAFGCVLLLAIMWGGM